MVNYGKGKVYKIWSPTHGDKIYIGSTTKEYLSQRMDHHRADYKRQKAYLTAFILFEEYGMENCKIELLEAKECTSKEELLQLEGKYIRELECVNKYIAGRTQKEWREDNKEYYKKYSETHKEEIKENKKVYRDEHKEEIKEYQKEYQETHKEEIAEQRKIYSKTHKEQKKLYREAHKEEIKENNKQYYLKKKMEQKSE
jgi:hypothetical protein